MFFIRNMKPEDVGYVADIEKTCFSDPWSFETVKEGLDNKFDTWFVLLEGDTVIGFLVLRIIANEGELLRIALLPEYRGKGLSKKLMDQLVKSSIYQFVKSLYLEVRITNETARNLYKSYGFIETGIRKNYYRNPKEDAVVMCYDLI